MQIANVLIQSVSVYALVRGLEVQILKVSLFLAVLAKLILCD